MKIPASSKIPALSKTEACEHPIILCSAFLALNVGYSWSQCIWWYKSNVSANISWCSPPRACERWWMHWTHLCEEYAELLKRLQQTGISDLLDDKDTFWRRVPRQSLAGGVLNVPEHRNTTSDSSDQDIQDKEDQTTKKERETRPGQARSNCGSEVFSPLIFLLGSLE